MLWAQIAVIVVILVPVSALLMRYAARRGDSGYRFVDRLAHGSGGSLGGGTALLFTNLPAALFLLAVGAAQITFFLLWFRRPRVGPPRTR